MIRYNFEQGNFPISRRSPVICIFERILKVVYNRFDLKKAINLPDIRICLGIWPGKKNTDCFVLNPEAYLNSVVPPEEHKDIDSAEKITIMSDLQKKFIKIIYIPGNFDNNKVPIESKDMKLFDYIKNTGLKHETIIE